MIFVRVAFLLMALVSAPSVYAQGWLGVELYPGAFVAGVHDKGPAKQAGIVKGDIVTTFDGKNIHEAADLARAVAEAPVGKTVDVVIIRDGGKETKTAKVGRREDAAPSMDQLGKRPEELDLRIAPPGQTAMRALATGVYALDEEIIFNVLDQVDYDSKTGQIALTGHLDTNYQTTGIPYLEYLATLLDNPGPELSLEWTAESNRRVSDFRRRTGSDAELKKLAREWGTWMDPAGHVTSAGRNIMPMFGIKPPIDGTDDPWQKMDRYQIISAVIAAAGNKKGALIVDAYRRMHQTSPNPSQEAVISVFNATETYELLQKLGAQVRQGKLTYAQSELQLFRAVCQSFDRIFNLSNQPVTQFFDRSIQQGKSVGESYDAATVVEFERQLRTVFETSLRTLWRSKPEIQIPLNIVSPSLRDTLVVVPDYRGIENKSLLAKLLFDADYISKRFVNSPELMEKIPGYQTQFTFRRSHPGARSIGGSGESRFWTSIERINASRSTDGNVLAFGEVKMRFHIRELGADGRDLSKQQSNEYEKLLSSLYEGFARQYSDIFHQLREAAKLAYAARWLKTKNPEPRFPASGRSVWEGPSSMPGFMFVAWSPIGEDVMTWSAVGGVSLRAPVPAVPPAVCVKYCEDNIPTDSRLKPAKDTVSTSGMLDLVQGTDVSRLPAANLMRLYLKLPGLRLDAEIAGKEEQKRRQEELALARKYPAVGPAPPPPPIQKPLTVIDRARLKLSDLVNIAREEIDRVRGRLPQMTRGKIRGALFTYIFEHAIPSEYGQMFWNVNVPTINDFNTVFDRIRSDLAAGGLDKDTEGALEALKTNLWRRIGSAANDTTKTEPKE